MSTIARITITRTAAMAQAVRGAVEAGEYASSSEIIREASAGWTRHPVAGASTPGRDPAVVSA